MKKQLFSFWIALIAMGLAGCNSSAKVTEIDADPAGYVGNPVLPGYYADPSLVQYNGKYYLYVTADPWGADFLACWESDDFHNWTFHALNWPTKEACRTPESSDSQVWAPSVIQKGDKFYMYVSVGSEIWCGVASHPLGPWENMLGDEVMIGYDLTKYYHVIDAEAFTDEDGKSYLYWGSGWNWINGHCYVAELNDEMSGFRTEPIEVTPENYFEGPLMNRVGDVYFLTYSDGVTMNDTYKVRYATGDSPLGPFKEAANSPILVTHEDRKVYGPGHHTIGEIGGETYILYHKHRLPYVEGTAFRQLCIDPIVFDGGKGVIDEVIPTDGIYLGIKDKKYGTNLPLYDIKATSQSANYTTVTNLTDGSFQTLWRAAEGDANPVLTLELQQSRQVSEVSVLFEYAWHAYAFRVETSADGTEWKELLREEGKGMIGSPYIIPVKTTCKYIRLTFNSPEVAIWDVKVY